MKVNWTLIALVVLVVAVGEQSYSGRLELRNQNVHACTVRAKPRDQAAGRGWAIAAKARQETADNPKAQPLERTNAAWAAKEYRRIAATLHRLSEQDCGQVFPRPSPFRF